MGRVTGLNVTSRLRWVWACKQTKNMTTRICRSPTRETIGVRTLEVRSQDKAPNLISQHAVARTFLSNCFSYVIQGADSPVLQEALKISVMSQVELWSTISLHKPLKQLMRHQSFDPFIKADFCRFQKRVCLTSA